MFCRDTVPFIGSNREEPFDSTEEDIHLVSGETNAPFRLGGCHQVKGGNGGRNGLMKAGDLFRYVAL